MLVEVSIGFENWMRNRARRIANSSLIRTAGTFPKPVVMFTYVFLGPCRSLSRILVPLLLEILVVVMVS
jgi:hypothetical protein